MTSPAASPSHDRDVTLLYLIKQVELAVRQALDDVVATADLTTLQYTALTVLERHPGITSAELARNSFVRAQSMAEMVTYLLGPRPGHPGARRAEPQAVPPVADRRTGSGSSTSSTTRSPTSSPRMLEGFDAGQTEILRTYLVRCRHSLSGNAPR